MPSLEEGLAEDSSHGLLPVELPELFEDRELVRLRGTVCASDLRMLPV